MGGRLLASLFLAQRTSCRQRSRGHDAPAKKNASCQKFRKCQDQIEQGNVPSAIWKMPCRWRGRDLSPFAKANFPPSGVDQSQSQSQRQGQSQRNTPGIAKTGRRQDKGVAKTGRRQDKGVAKIDVAKEVISHQQCYSPIPMGRKDHGGSDSAGGFRPA